MTTGRVYGGQTADQRAARRRSAVLAAGLELFGTRAFPDVAVADVLAASGQTRRAFYELFKDREDLLRAVDRELVRDPLLQILNESDAFNDWTDAQALLTQVLDFYANDTRRAHVAFIAVVGVGDELERHRADVSAPLVQRLAQLLGPRAGTTEADRVRATIGYLGALSTLLIAHQRGTAGPYPEVRRELERLMQARFFPPAA